MPRKVLVSYLDRNKIFSLPDSADISDVKYLSQEFLTAFSFSAQNVNIVVVFQKYDSDWDTFVDIEEDSVLSDRDRLKAVIMPILNEENSKPQSAASVDNEEDQGSECSAAESSNSKTSSSNIQCHAIETHNTRSETESVTSQSRKRSSESLSSEIVDNNTPTLGYDCEDLLPEKEVVITTSASKPKKVKIKENPLPDPFPLPGNYRPDVEVALSSGNMTESTKRAFFTQVAGAIFNYKSYPTKDELTCVASEVIRRYPFIGTPSQCGSKTGAIVETLKARFKEFCRPTRDRQNSATIPEDKKPPPAKKKPGVSVSHLMQPPPFPEGEDETSMLRHASILRGEHDKKRRANTQIVNSLMEKTFPFRRAQALDPNMDLKTLLNQYPFMQNTEQLYLDMDRILLPIHNATINHVTISESWGKFWVPRIFKQAGLEQSNKNLKAALKIAHQESPTSALVLLPYLLKDSRVGPDSHRLLHPIPDTADITTEIKRKEQNEPYLLCCGDICNAEQLYLIIEREVMCEISNSDAVFALLSAFFVFNIEYTVGCSNVYVFLERALLGLDGKATPTVAHFMSVLAALKL